MVLQGHLQLCCVRVSHCLYPSSDDGHLDWLCSVTFANAAAITTDAHALLWCVGLGTLWNVLERCSWVM